MTTDKGPGSARSLAEEYRRLIRWYPRSWRAANEDAMLGALLDQAESEGRRSLTRGERSAMRRNGAARRFGIVGNSDSGWTLAVGGVGIVLGTILPLVSMMIFIFPPPLAQSWLYFAQQPTWDDSSGCVLILAFIVLAFGVGREGGIVGASVLGKVALVLYPIALLAQSFVDAHIVSLETSRLDSTLIAVASWTSIVVEFASLSVAAVVVARAGVVQGLARWGLLVFAALSLIMLVMDHVRVEWVGQIVIWCWLGLLVIRLLVGVIYLSSSRIRLRTPRLPMETNRA